MERERETKGISPWGRLDGGACRTLSRSLLVLLLLLVVGCGGGGGNGEGLEAPSDLVYAANPATYVVDIPISPNTPSSAGGAVEAYAISPALPAGLSLDPTTGAISGTPTEIASTAVYTVTASNSGGSATVELSVSVVVPPPPLIIVGPRSQPVVVGFPGYFTVWASGAGGISYQWRKDGVPIAGADSSSYLTSSLVLTDDGAAFTVVVKDAYGGSITSREAVLSVGSGFSAAGTLATRRFRHTATALRNGKVLLVGGEGEGGTPLPGVEVYDMVNGASRAITSMKIARTGHSATFGGLSPYLAPVVVIAGGWNPTDGFTDCVEVYFENAGGAFFETGSLMTPRADHTATLLPNRKVLIAGGRGGYGSTEVFLGCGELFNIDAMASSVTGNMGTARKDHTATLLKNGLVLITGGEGVDGPLSGAELYDPDTRTFFATGDLGTARTGHTATPLPDGKVLIAGGEGVLGPMAGAELYDPATGTFTGTGSLGTARAWHTATILPDGKVLLTGGSGASGVLASAELYDPARGTFTATGDLGTELVHHTATLLHDGRVFLAGGAGSHSGPCLAGVEIFDPLAGRCVATGSMGTPRDEHSATLLEEGDVLIAGGWSGYIPTSSAELFSPDGENFSVTGGQVSKRAMHAATLLPGGKVLLTGGSGASGDLGSAELYDPARGIFTATGNLDGVRWLHTATLLANGKVLVAGGFDSGHTPASEALYDPVTGTFSATGSLGTGRMSHTATLLRDGKVLIAGGEGEFWDILTSAELYDPETGTFTPTGDLGTARSDHTATLFPDGRVLLAGGSGVAEGTAEIYDPQTGTFSHAGMLAALRWDHTATLLPNGKVLLAGGGGNADYYTFSYGMGTTELYDPSKGFFMKTGGLNSARTRHTATLLPDGRVLLAGGLGDSGPSSISDAEVYRWW